MKHIIYGIISLLLLCACASTGSLVNDETHAVSKSNAIVVSRNDNNVVIDYYLDNYNGFKLMALLNGDYTYVDATDTLISVSDEWKNALEEFKTISNNDVYWNSVSLWNDDKCIHFQWTSTNDKTSEMVEEWDSTNYTSYKDYSTDVLEFDGKEN